MIPNFLIHIEDSFSEVSFGQDQCREFFFSVADKRLDAIRRKDFWVIIL